MVINCNWSPFPSFFSLSPSFLFFLHWFFSFFVTYSLIFQYKSYCMGMCKIGICTGAGFQQSRRDYDKKGVFAKLGCRMWAMAVATWACLEEREHLWKDESWGGSGPEWSEQPKKFEESMCTEGWQSPIQGCLNPMWWEGHWAGVPATGWHKKSRVKKSLLRRGSHRWNLGTGYWSLGGVREISN